MYISPDDVSICGKMLIKLYFKMYKIRCSFLYAKHLYVFIIILQWQRYF